MIEKMNDSDELVDEKFPERRVMPCTLCHSTKFAITSIRDFDENGWFAIRTETCENGHSRKARVDLAPVKVGGRPFDL